MALTVTKEVSKDVGAIRLTGVIDDHSDLSVAIGDVHCRELLVDCGGVNRINSMGVKNWMLYFTSARAKGRKLRFVNCSPTIVQQVNIVSNFLCGGEVESLQIPFACEDCDHIFTETFEAQAIKRQNFVIGNRKCVKCGGANASFDEVPKVYFRFLMA